MGMSHENPGKVPGTNRNWSVDRVKGGTKWVGYKAGECFGVYVHPEPSKPCLTLYTGGALKCPGCEGRKKVEWVGYCPLWREDSGNGVVVVIREGMLETFRGMGLLNAALISRGTNKHDTVSVAPFKPVRRLETRRPERQKAASVVQWLLDTLWGLPEYARWCDSNDARLPVDEEIIRINAAAVERQESFVGGDLGRRVLDKLLQSEGHRPRDGDTPPTLGESIPEPSKNGTHKPRK